MATKTTDKAIRIERDLGIITRFIEVFCHAKHSPDSGRPDDCHAKHSPDSGRPDDCREKHAAEREAAGVESDKHALCPDCRDLLAYATERLNRCPMDPKPKCKDCPVHCYKPEYRRRIQEVMKFSGIYFVKRGRIDWLIKYFS